MKIIKNLIFYIYIKYFDIYYYFIKDIVVKNDLSMNYIPGDENLADIFTKNLDCNKYIIALDLFYIT